MGEYLDNMDGSIDFVAGQRKNRGRGTRDDGVPPLNTADLMEELGGRTHHGGGTQESAQPTIESPDSATTQTTEVSDSAKANNLMAAFSAAGPIGELTPTEAAALPNTETASSESEPVATPTIEIPEEQVDPIVDEPEPIEKVEGVVSSVSTEVPTVEAPPVDPKAPEDAEATGLEPLPTIASNIEVAGDKLVSEQVPEGEPVQPASIEVPPTEIKASRDAIKEQIYEARRQGSERDIALFLGLAVQHGYLGIDGRGQAVAKTPDEESLLKAAGKFRKQEVAFVEPVKTELQGGREANPATETGQPPASLKGELHNLEQGLSKLRRSLEKADEDGGGRLVRADILKLEERRAEIRAELFPTEEKAEEPQVAKGSPTITPSVEAVSPVESAEAGAEGRIAEILSRIEQIYKDPDSDAELMELRSEYRELLKEEELDERRSEARDAFGAEIFSEETEEHKQYEKMSPEEIVEQSEAAFLASPLGEAIRAKVVEAREIQRPGKVNFVLRTIRRLTSPKWSQKYEAEVGAYKKAQEDIRHLALMEKDWVARESLYLGKANESAPRISELSLKAASGDISSRERKELDKLVNKILIRRKAADLFVDTTVRSLIPEGMDDLKELSTRPKIKAAPAKSESPTEPDSSEKMVVSKEIIEKIENNPRFATRLRDLGPEYRDAFFSEQAGETIRDYAMSAGELERNRGRIKSLVADGFIKEPGELFTLMQESRELALQSARAEKALEASVRGYGSKKMWGDWGNDLISSTKNAFANSMGSDAGFEEVKDFLGRSKIDADTELMDIIQNGHSDYARRLQSTISAGVKVGKVGNYAAKILTKAGAYINEGLGALYVDTAKFKNKSLELQGKVDEIDLTIEGINEFLAKSGETRQEAEARMLGRIITEVEADVGLRDSAVRNVINELQVTKATKEFLLGLYEKEGLVDAFADSLMTALEVSKINAVSERARLKDQMEQLSSKVELLETQGDVLIERSDGSLELADATDFDEEMISLAAAEQRLADYERQINQRVLSQIQSLNGKVEASLLSKIRSNIGEAA